MSRCYRGSHRGQKYFSAKKSFRHASRRRAPALRRGPTPVSPHAPSVFLSLQSSAPQVNKNPGSDAEFLSCYNVRMNERPRKIHLLRESLAKRKAAENAASTLPLAEKFDRFLPNTEDGEMRGGRREEFTGLKTRIGAAFVRGVEGVFEKVSDALERKMKERGEWESYVGKQRAEHEAILHDSTPLARMSEEQYENFYEAAVKSVDQHVLRDLMTEHFLRAGASRDDMNFVKPFNIRVYKPSEKNIPSPNLSASMFYEGASNTLGVNVRKPTLDTIKLGEPLLDTPWGLRSVQDDRLSFEKGQYRIDYPTKPLLTAYITRGVIHEAFHSTTVMRVDNEGVHSEFRDEKTISDIFDEAVTDMEADETFIDYAKTHGIPGVSSKEAQVLVDLSNYLGIEGGGLLSPYARSKFFLDCTIEAFADKFGVPPDVVKRGIMRAQMRGLPNAQGEDGKTAFQRELRAAFDDGFRELEIARQVLDGMAATMQGHQNFNASQLFRFLKPEAQERLIKKYFTIPEGITLTKVDEIKKAA